MASFYGTDKSNVKEIDVSKGYNSVAKGLEIIANLENDKKQAELNNMKIEQAKLDLDNSYAKNTQNAIDETYMKYVNPETGVFNKAQLEKDNVGLPLNQVSSEAQKKAFDIQSAYKTKKDAEYEKLDTLAQNTINDELIKESTKYQNKEDFMKNVNPDLYKFADGKTIYSIEKGYDDTKTKLTELQHKKEMLAMQEKVYKATKDSDGATGKKIKAADSSQISKTVDKMFDGESGFDGDWNVDPKLKETSLEVKARAEEIYKNTNLTHTESAKMAYYEIVPKITNPADPKEEDNDPLNLLK